MRAALRRVGRWLEARLVAHDPTDPPAVRAELEAMARYRRGG